MSSPSGKETAERALPAWLQQTIDQKNTTPSGAFAIGYVRDRLEYHFKAKEKYRKHAIRNDFIQSASIKLAPSAAALATFNVSPKVTGPLTILFTLGIGWAHERDKKYQFNERWLMHEAVITALKKEENQFLGNAGPYSIYRRGAKGSPREIDLDKQAQLLIQRCTEIEQQAESLYLKAQREININNPAESPPAKAAPAP